MKRRYITSQLFDQHFDKRISPNEELVKDYIESVDSFFQDPKLVGDHDLESVMQDKRAFWINDNYRVVYRKRNGTFIFLDIGTHEQVYKRRTKKS